MSYKIFELIAQTANYRLVRFLSHCLDVWKRLTAERKAISRKRNRSGVHFSSLLVFVFFWSGCSQRVNDATSFRHPVELSDEQQISKRIRLGRSNNRVESQVARPSGRKARPIPIGYDEIPQLISYESHRAWKENRKALRLHSLGRYDESVVGFENALKISGNNYPGARFNLACALSKLGRVRESADQLKVLLRKDLPRFLVRVSEDEDLEPLRKSAYFKQIERHIKTLLPIWQKTSKQGVSAVIEGRLNYPHNFKSKRWSQAGVYLHKAKRFVPMAPPVYSSIVGRQAIPLTSSYHDQENRRVVSVSGSGSNTCSFLIGDLTVSVFDVPTGKGLAKIRIVDNITAFEVKSNRDGVWIAHDASPSKGNQWFQLYKSGLEADGGEAQHRLKGTQEGVWLTQKKQENCFVKSRDFYCSGKVFSVSTEHKIGSRYFVLRRDASPYVGLFSWKAYIGVLGGYSEWFSGEVVDTRDGSSFDLGHGVEGGAVALGADGALYWQIGHELRRYSSMGTKTYEKAMKGVLLQAFPLRTHENSSFRYYNLYI